MLSIQMAVQTGTMLFETKKIASIEVKTVITIFRSFP